jgi:hypothetical protein
MDTGLYINVSALVLTAGLLFGFYIEFRRLLCRLRQRRGSALVLLGWCSEPVQYLNRTNNETAGRAGEECLVLSSAHWS